MTSKEGKALSKFRSYIVSFNNQDIDAIRRTLHANVEIYVDGNKVAEGRESILPSYEADFNIGKEIEITRGPEIVSENNIGIDGREMVVKVDVGLKAIVTGVMDKREEGAREDSITTLDVTYVYDLQTMKQVRHLIRNVHEEK